MFTNYSYCRHYNHEKGVGGDVLFWMCTWPPNFCFQKLFPPNPLTVAIPLCFRAKAHFLLEALPSVVAQGS